MASMTPFDCSVLYTFLYVLFLIDEFKWTPTSKTLVCSKNVRKQSVRSAWETICEMELQRTLSGSLFQMSVRQISHMLQRRRIPLNHLPHLQTGRWFCVLQIFHRYIWNLTYLFTDLQYFFLKNTICLYGVSLSCVMKYCARRYLYTGKQHFLGGGSTGGCGGGASPNNILRFHTQLFYYNINLCRPTYILFLITEFISLQDLSPPLRSQPSPLYGYQWLCYCSIWETEHTR